VAALVRVTPNFRAILAAHVTFQLVDGRRLWPPHDVQVKVIDISMDELPSKFRISVDTARAPA